MGEWTGADFVGAIAAVGVIITAWRQYRIERGRASNTAFVDRESLVDDRINAHLLRLDTRVEELERQNKDLEQEVEQLRRQLDEAVRWVRKHDLPWPPPATP